MIALTNGRATAAIDPSYGGRIARLVVDDVDVIASGDPARDDPLDWGLYPMVPFAGRLRNGTLEWRGSTHQFPRLRPPHALHGTVHDVEWRVDRVDASSCLLSTSLMDPWPFSGSVFHDVVLHPDRLELRLTLRADVDMPAQLGWHPWFRKPERLVFASHSVHRSDSDGIADRYSVPVEDLVEGDLDDCFTDVDENLTITISERELHLRSSCLHWVVYDRPVHATCIEPQSGPPNVLNTNPRIVVAGSSTSEWFTISWDE